MAFDIDHSFISFGLVIITNPGGDYAERRRKENVTV